MERTDADKRIEDEMVRHAAFLRRVARKLVGAADEADEETDGDEEEGQ